MINIYTELINIELQINQGVYLFIKIINYKIITKIIKKLIVTYFYQLI